MNQVGVNFSPSLLFVFIFKSFRSFRLNLHFRLNWLKQVSAKLRPTCFFSVALCFLSGYVSFHFLSQNTRAIRKRTVDDLDFLICFVIFNITAVVASYVIMGFSIFKIIFGKDCIEI